MTRSVARTSASETLIYAILLLGLLLLSGCATNQSENGANSLAEYDPWEPLNRNLYDLNIAIDRVSTKPLAKGYRKIMPAVARRGITNIFDNLTTPRSALNNFLQGKPARGFSEIGRFIFNSTLGIAGLVDVAELGGMGRYDEDFAQTFAVWGVPEGPFVVLPILGPHSLLDAVSLPFDFYSDLQPRIDNTSLRDKMYVLRIIDRRQRLLAADIFLDESQDPYITFREAYRQNREYLIYDGDPPIEDDYYEIFDEEFE
jgi:phospholipid-binding lipoprotein MlaA